MRIVLYQPDIPPNTGTILRLAACLGIAVDIVEPTGFPWSDRTLRRAGLDYLDRVEIVRHADFAAYDARRRAEGRRLVLLTAHGDTVYTRFDFTAGDALMAGRESAGVPDAVRAAADARIAVPMNSGFRSLNVAVATAMVAGEALRQTGLLPGAGERQ